ncbi:hypothetical protein CKQ60_21245, partial [Acinetobacter baumannii]
PLLLDGVQEDPPALLHRRVRGLGTRARGCLTLDQPSMGSDPGSDPSLYGMKRLLVFGGEVFRCDIVEEVLELL